MKIGDIVNWHFKDKDEVFTSAIEEDCPLCGACAVIKLPPPLLAQQPDDTTHVCLPAAGGCNHGFAKD